MKAYKIKNTTGSAASDLHVVFQGTGGDITTVVIDQPAGCPVASIPSNPPTVGNEMIVNWGVECVAAGDSVTVKVTTPNGPLTVDSGFWTNLANPAAPGSGPVDDIRDIDMKDGPTRSQWGMITLVSLLLVGGTLVLMRKRAQAGVA